MRLRKKTAFTLIELLVVISIIAMLLAILMPSLRKAKESARLVKCGTNLHSIGQALHLYANDYNDRLIPGDFWNGWDVWAKVTEYPAGCSVPPSVEYREVNLGHLLASKTLEIPLSADHIFFCPSSRPKNGISSFERFEQQWGRKSDDVGASIDYMFNNSLDGYNDCVQDGEWAVLSHKTKVNFMLGDGSVSTFNVKPLPFNLSYGLETLVEVSDREGVAFPGVLLHQWFEKGEVDIAEANLFIKNPQKWISDNCDLENDGSGRAVSKSLSISNFNRRSLVADTLGIAGTPPAPPPPG